MWQMADSWEASQVCRSLSSPVEQKTHPEQHLQHQNDAETLKTGDLRILPHAEVSGQASLQVLCLDKSRTVVWVFA